VAARLMAVMLGLIARQCHAGGRGPPS